jgi:DNA-binding response OmpR family regulator/DNA-binding CsgD family transcriptional regulator
MAVVLVVDDEPDIRTLMRINLEGAGHRVVTAASGEEALDAVGREQPDAVFLDLMMPGLDGWDVLAALKSTGDGASDVPVFLVTALHDTDLRLRGGIEGALRYITKPFDPAELVRALDQVLDPAAPPERELRRRAQAKALEDLARAERAPGAGPSGERAETPRVRLTRLERLPSSPVPRSGMRQARERLAVLTEKQQRLVVELVRGGSVASLARRLGTSRSTVYASLRRICQRLGLRGTHELVELARRASFGEDR